MRKFLGSYNPVYTPTFQKQISKVDKTLKLRIKNCIDSLISDPWHHTEFMKGVRGRRKARVANGERLVFVICEECRELGHIKYNRCNDCKSTPENTLVVADLIQGHDYNDY